MQASPRRWVINRFVVPCVVLSLALAAAGAGADTPPTEPAKGGEPSPDELQARIAELINQLGASEFARRDAAQKELSEIGEPARAQLTDALEREDREVVFRAEALLKELELSRVTLVVTDKYGDPVGEKRVIVTLMHFVPYEMRRDGYTEPPPMKIKAVIPKDGRLTLGSFEPGTYNGQVWVKGFCRKQVSLTVKKGRHSEKVTVCRGGHLKGRVIDITDDNKPVSGLRFSTWIPGENRRRMTTTDANGEFQLKNLPPGQIRLSAQWTRHNYVFADGAYQKTLLVVDEETMEVTIEIVDERSVQGSIELKILGPDGRSHKGGISANVRYRGTSHYVLTYYRRISRGSFVLTCREGTYDIVLRGNKDCAPYILRNVTIKAGVTRKLRKPVRLSKPVRARVKVLGPDGKPLPHANVIVACAKGRGVTLSEYELDGENRSHGFWFASKTKENGTADFTELAQTGYAARAYHKEHGLSDEVVFDAKGGKETSAVEIDYGKRATLTLQVVDGKTGKPVANLNSMLGSSLASYHGGRHESRGHIRIGTSAAKPEPDKRGRVILFKDMENQPLILAAPGYKTMIHRIEEIPTGKKTEVRLEMEKSGKGDLKATIVPGKGLKLEDISAVYINDTGCFKREQGLGRRAFFRWGKRVKPGKDGTVEAKGLPEGLCYISVYGRNSRFIGAYRADIRKDVVSEVTFNTPGVGEVEGVLTGTGGKPLPGVEVTLTPDSLAAFLGFSRFSGHNNVLRVAKTDEKGRFRFEKVPKGDYVLSHKTISPYPDVKHVKVKAGESHKADIKLRKPVNASVKLDAPRTGDRYTQIALVDLSGNTTGLSMITPGSMIIPDRWYRSYGGCDLSGIYPGSYRIFISEPESQTTISRVVEIKPDTRKVEIKGTFEPGACTVSGRLLHRTTGITVPFGLGLVLAVSDGYAATGLIWPDGTFKFEKLHPGTYRLHILSVDSMCVNGAEFRSVKEVTVEEGADIEGIIIP